METDLFSKKLRAVIDSFAARAHQELNLRWKAWATELSRNDLQEVVGALMARQVTLAIQLAQSPPVWNEHIAPIILRTMADTYITLVWILEDPSDRSRKFIHYGLGQDKLQLEHRRADMKTRQPYEGENEALNAVEEWINRQRALFLTEVDLGSWSGISTRKMAEEANCLDFYNYVYTPSSACTHSMWHHVARYNLKQCANPLHQYHAVPSVPNLPIDSHYFYLSAKYLEKTFAAFDKHTLVCISGPSAFETARRGLEELGEISDERGTGE